MLNCTVMNELNSIFLEYADLNPLPVSRKLFYSYNEDFYRMFSEAIQSQYKSIIFDVKLNRYLSALSGEAMIKVIRFLDGTSIKDDETLDERHLLWEVFTGYYETNAYLSHDSRCEVERLMMELLEPIIGKPSEFHDTLTTVYYGLEEIWSNELKEIDPVEFSWNLTSDIRMLVSTFYEAMPRELPRYFKRPSSEKPVFYATKAEREEAELAQMMEYDDELDEAIRNTWFPGMDV